ncbi:MAG: hypothetical protein JOZ87_29950 [Chloroflexi bacterium]|nr:hypothetical protein [Chloroflexota bacterium]
MHLVCGRKLTWLSSSASRPIPGRAGSEANSSSTQPEGSNSSDCATWWHRYGELGINGIRSVLNGQSVDHALLALLDHDLDAHGAPVRH